MERDESLTSLLDELRKSVFADLAVQIETMLAEGKSELVLERTTTKNRERVTFFEPVTESERSLSAKKLAKLDLRVKPYETAEEKHRILLTILRQFVEPSKLVPAIREVFAPLNIQGITFANPANLDERTSIEQYEKHFSSDEVKQLADTIQLEIGEAR